MNSLKEKTVYFLERKRDGKWWSYCHVESGRKQYTSNPHKALAYDTRKELEDICEDDEVITEHIYIQETDTFI